MPAPFNTFCGVLTVGTEVVMSKKASALKVRTGLRAGLAVISGSSTGTGGGF
jgi:hypothetical protein